MNCWKAIDRREIRLGRGGRKKYKNVRTAYGRYLKKRKSVTSGSGRYAVLSPEFNNLDSSHEVLSPIDCILHFVCESLRQNSVVGPGTL